MDTVPRSRRALEPRLSGKIVRARRTLSSKTPYDRPSLPSRGSDENPNWLNRIVLSPTRSIATRAGKLLTSVFGSEESSSSSSSSDDDVDDEDDISFEKTDEFPKKDGISDIVNCLTMEPQSTVGKAETKHIIEQLLLHETFSREECDRLVQIIKSRVIEFPTIDKTVGQILPETPNRTVGFDIDMPDLCNTAVLEAKKWLNEKKSGSNLKSNSDYGTGTLNSAILQQVTNEEAGSPADVAKSYMRARPSWTSPSTDHVKKKPTSPLGIHLFGDEAPFSIGGIHLFGDETPFSIGGSSLSSSKVKLARDSPSSGLWNIQEEIQKVRSKATEEMLKTLPSAKIDRSLFSSDHKSTSNPLGSGRVEILRAEKTEFSTKAVNASLNLFTEITTSKELPDMERVQDLSQNEASFHDPASTASQQNKELDGITIIEGKGSRNGLEEITISCEQGLHSSDDPRTKLHSDSDAGRVELFKDSNGTNQQPNSSAGEKKIIADRECSTSNDAAAANGFPHSTISQEKTTPATSNVPVEETTCELLSETRVEVPDNKENDTAASESQKAVVEQEPLEPKTRHRAGTRVSTGTTPDNQRGKRMRSYSRKLQ